MSEETLPAAPRASDGPATPHGAPPAQPHGQPARAAHPLRDPRLAIPLAVVVLLVNLPFLQTALRGPAEVTTGVPFHDRFDRASLGNDYWSNGGAYRIVDGQLYAPGTGNNPLWLKARLPADVKIDFDVRSEAADGDIKVEAFGDGRNHSTGYLFLFGAWHNRESRIAKLDEHALTEAELKARLAGELRPYPRVLTGMDALLESIQRPFVEWQARSDLEKLEQGKYYRETTPLVVKRADLHVVKGRTYHMTIARRGQDVRWDLDGQTLLELHDPAPLSGRGHDRFAFSSWQNDTYFDNLVIEPL